MVRPTVGFACALLVGLLVAPCTLALPANGSGNYTQILCANPSSEEGLGIPGMPEGLTNPASIDTWQVTTSQANCASGHLTPNRGVPMAVGQGNTYGQGTWSALLYQAPGSVAINGGTIYRAEKAQGANSGFMGIIQQGGEYANLYSLPRNSVDQGDWFSGNVASRGTFSWPFSPENAVTLTISADGGHWAVNATCDPNGNNNSSCTLTQDQWEYRIFGGEISLNAVNDPQASNITGPMMSETSLRGTESVTFSASDEGPGLAYVKLIVDGSTVQSQTIDANNGHCVPVRGRDAYTWAYQVPCKTSVGGRTYELNTALVADGSHHVQVIIEDAAGNESIVVDRTVGTNNAPANSAPPTISSGGQPLPGTTLTAGSGTWSAPAGAGNLTYGYQWQDCDGQGSSCQNIPGAQSAGYSPTTSDSAHTLRVLVSAADSDGMSSAPSAASGVVSSPQLPVGIPSAGVDAFPAGSWGSGASNGMGASDSAQLHLQQSGTISRPYARSAIALSGRLSDAQGHPIAGAVLDVLAQSTGDGAAVVIGHTRTLSDGSFLARVGAGPSRVLRLGYRAFSGDPSYTAQAQVGETVAAGVHLEVSPRLTASTSTITLSGTVHSPIPRQGTIVELLVHYRGRWEPFRTPRSTATGRFAVSYQFEGAVGRFPFRAEVPGGQAGYPYNTGYSNTVTVRTR